MTSVMYHFYKGKKWLGNKWDVALQKISFLQENVKLSFKTEQQKIGLEKSSIKKNRGDNSN